MDASLASIANAYQQSWNTVPPQKVLENETNASKQLCIKTMPLRSQLTICEARLLQPILWQRPSAGELLADRFFAHLKVSH